MLNMLPFNFLFQFCKQKNQSLFYNIYSLHKASFIVYLTFLKNHSLTLLGTCVIYNALMIS